MRNEDLLNKWKPVLEHSALPEIGNSHKLPSQHRFLKTLNLRSVKVNHMAHLH
jgi:hypothetical protein